MVKFSYQVKYEISRYQVKYEIFVLASTKSEGEK